MRNKGGFSLIESMVSVFISSLFVLGAASALPVAAVGEKKMEHRLEARQVAQQVLQSQLVEPQPGVQPAVDKYRVTVSVRQTDVVVQVSWQEFGTNQTILAEGRVLQ